MNQNVVILIGAGVLAFVGGTVLLTQVNRGPSGNSTAVAPAPPAADPQPDPPRKEEPPAPPPKKDAPPPPAMPATPVRTAVLKRWELTQPPQPRGEESPNFERYFCREIGVDQTGLRVLTQTQLEAVTWEAMTGTRSYTFKAASQTIPRKPPDKPELRVEEEIFITRDARIVARVRRDGSQVRLHDAASGAALGTYKPRKGMSSYFDHHPPAFTPAGDYLFLMHQQHQLAAIDTRTARGAIVDLPRDWGRARTEMWRVLVAVPAESAFIRHTIGDQGVFVLDGKTGKERRLTAVSIEPFSLFENRGIKLSPDGRYLSARTSSTLDVVDWKADRRVLNVTGRIILNEWFTPDAKRMVVARDTDIIRYQNYKRLTPVGGWLELWDIEKGVKIGECILDKQGLTQGIKSLAFSGDGKKFALGDGNASVALLDFEAAFGVAPLPPVPRPERESLPLR